MSISEEIGWVGLNLRNLESSASVNTAGIDTSPEGTSQTSNTTTNHVVANGIGNGDTWWTCEAFVGLVDVCCCQGWGLVWTFYAFEGDVLKILSVSIMGNFDSGGGRRT